MFILLKKNNLPSESIVNADIWNKTSSLLGMKQVYLIEQ